MLTRRPAPRPWDVIALELLLSVASAILVGLLLWLAVGTWDDRGVAHVTIGVLVVVALAVGAGWFLWLTGMTGWVLAAAGGIAALQVAFLLVLSFAGQLHGISTTVLVIALAAAILAAACGIFLPAPSSRRYRPTPRERTEAGGPPTAPRISPSVAAAADRYAKPVVASAAAVTAASAKKLSRTPSPAPAADEDGDAADPDPVLQPRAGTPIRTSGPVDPDAMPVTPPRGTPAAGNPVQASARSTTSARSTPSATSAASADPSTTPGRGTSTAAPSPTTSPGKAPSAKGSGKAAATPAAASPTRPPTAGAPRPDPGAIARQARASIDAELAKPRGSARVPGSTGTPAAASTPGFRTVDPPPPARRVPASRTDVRFTPSGRTAPPPPPRGQPVGRVADTPQPGDPGSVAPTFRSVTPPPPTSPAGIDDAELEP